MAVARLQPSGQAAVRACRGMVATPHHLATQAGVAALYAGGNAADAAVAASAVLAVVYPHMAGVGGDLFLLFWDARERRLIGLNASGWSAGLATPEWYVARGCTSIPERGPLAALTVPGAVAGWAEFVERYGRRGLDAALAPAVRHAREGFPVARSLASWLQRDESLLAGYPATAAAFLPRRRRPREGERLRLPDLGDTLAEVARGGAAAFYRGALAERTCEALAAAGSPLRGDDLAAYRPRWVTPLLTTYRDHQVCTLPPNSQGFVLLEMLNVVEGFDLRHGSDRSPRYVHLLVEATRLAFRDRDRYLADPDFAPAPLGELLSDDHAARLRGLLSGAAGEISPAPAGGDTVYFCAADDEGNVASVIQSLYFDFGSAFVAGDTGVLLQNRGTFFSLAAGEANCLAPRKRPAHTLMPAMILRGGLPVAALGSMGGEGQPQTVAAVATRLLDFDLDVQRAVAAPRWLFGRTWGTAAASLTLEAGFPAATVAGLRARGYQVAAVPPWSEVLGHAQALRIDREQGVFAGAADPRSDGAAAGV